MSAKASGTLLRRRALRIDQDAEHPLYLFTLTGEELARIADISRVSRNEGGELIGYQRPEVRRHVDNIVEYLDGEGPVVFPNSVILALSSSVGFTQSRGPKVDEGLALAGTLEIPLPEDGQPKPGFIVDGQQRTIALMRSRRAATFPVPVSAFIADDVNLQRDQFLRINSARPLPRGLINELLPEVGTTLPAHLGARKAPAALCDMLNRDPESPFYGLIRRASTPPDDKKAVVTDTVVVRMLHESFMTPSGALFPFRNLATGVTDFAGVRVLLLAFWRAVRDTFPEAWGLAPEKSRLMHGAGIRAMGRVMDRAMSTVDATSAAAKQQLADELKRIKPYCRWTHGVWEELDGLQWNEVQNVHSHVRTLSNYLVRAYLNSRKAAHEVLLPG